MGKFVSVGLCVTCNKEIPKLDRAYNDGVCPKCGHRPATPILGPYGHKLCEVKETVVYKEGFFERFYKHLCV